MKIRSTLALSAFLAVQSPLAAAPTQVEVPMKALNGSRQTGTAVLTQTTAGVRVELKLANAAGKVEPTHIHLGTCDAISKSPEYALVDTSDGSSATTVPGVTLEQLLAKPYAINVHKSLKELHTYVSCGNIK